MSKEQTATRDVPELAKNNNYQATTELEKKLMQIGHDHSYTVEVRQRGQTRFCRVIQESQTNRRSRVVIPMSIIGKFCEMLKEISKFASTYTPKNISERKSPKEKIEFAMSDKFFSPGGRRYYFDVVDADDTLTARISYVFNERDVVLIFVDALASLVSLLEEFSAKYPSLTPDDDYPMSQNRSRFNRFGQPRRSPRGFTRGRFRRSYGSTRPQYYNGNATTSARPADSARPANLKVLSDPAPAQVTHNSKKFTFEVVEGDNTFLRITERINENRKSTLHVPIEVCAQIQSLIGDMSKKLTISQSKVPAGGVAPTSASK